MSVFFISSMSGLDHLGPPGAGVFQLRFQAVAVAPPVCLNLVVHAHGGGLVDADHHGFAAMAAAQEMGHQVLGDGLQALLAGDQVVLAGELALQLGLLGLVQLGRFQQPLHVLVEMFVGKLKFGDAVFVVERHGGPVFDGLGEIVDADIIPKHLAGLFLTGHQRCAGKADEGGIGQGVAHVQGEHVVLAAVGLVGDDDDVVALA